MSPPISSVQRSPLGAMYRTPLNVLGSVVDEEPPLVPLFTGTVTFVGGPFDQSVGFQTNPCLTSTAQQNPVIQMWREEFFFGPVVSDPPTSADIMGYFYLGTTSGFIMNPIAWAPDYICGVWFQQPPQRQKFGTGVPMDVFTSYLIYDQALELTRQADYGFNMWSHIGPIGFINGETIEAYAQDPNA